VFDTVGGDDFEKALAILTRGGVAVSMTAQADEKAATLGVTAITQQTHVTSEALAQLAQLVEANVVTPQIGATYPFEQIRQAFEAREGGTVHGKVVLVVKD
jgi:NADPH2:quinone reductase